MKTETTEPQLTESDVSELERAQIERRKSAEFQRLPIPPFVEDIDALIRDWRALRAENEQLRLRVLELETEIDTKAGYL